MEAGANCEQKVPIEPHFSNYITANAAVVKRPARYFLLYQCAISFRFARAVGSFEHALEFLFAVGFERRTEAWAPGLPSEGILVLTRNDPGLLWIGAEHIRKWRAALL